MKTLLKTTIPEGTRGVLYFCEYDYEKVEIKVVGEMCFSNSFTALNTYSNIPNPASQLAMGETYGEMCLELKVLHINMEDKKWLKQLGETM